MSVKTLGSVNLSKRTRSRRADIPAQCAQVISPACLQAIYNIPATPATAAANSLGVSGFGGEVANQGDLTVRVSVFVGVRIRWG